MGIGQKSLEGSQQPEFVEDQEKPDHYQKDAGDLVDDVDKFCGPLHDIQDGMDEKRKNQKGQGKACGIHGQKENSFEHRVLVAGHDQDGTQHGPDAGAPACAKGHADDKGADKMQGFSLDMEPPVKIKGPDFDESEKMKPEHDHNAAAKVSYDPGILGGNAAQE
jgi:hypothetical protein